MPSHGRFKARSEIVKAARDRLRSTGWAPGIRRGQSLDASAYLGNDLDFIALFSGRFQRRCHIIIEEFDGMYNVQCWLGLCHLGRGQKLRHSIPTARQLREYIAKYHDHLTATLLEHSGGYHHYSEFFDLKPQKTNRLPEPMWRRRARESTSNEAKAMLNADRPDAEYFLDHDSDDDSFGGKRRRTTATEVAQGAASGPREPGMTPRPSVPVEQQPATDRLDAGDGSGEAPASTTELAEADDVEMGKISAPLAVTKADQGVSSATPAASAGMVAPLPAPAPATSCDQPEQLTTKRGWTKRCSKKHSTAPGLWCTNCLRLDADGVTDKRLIVREYPCLGAKSTSSNAQEVLPRRDAPRERYEPETELRVYATGQRRTFTSDAPAPESAARQPTGGIAASFANAQARSVVEKLRAAFEAYDPDGDGANLDPAVEHLVTSLVFEKAAAQESSQRANAEAVRAKRDADKAKRQLAASVQKDHDIGPPHQPTIDALIGTGFGSDRTLRRHAADWVSKICEAYPDDTLKQVQLAVALAERLALKAHNHRSTKDERTRHAIIESLQLFYSTIRDRYEGRFPNQVRDAYHTVSMAISIAGKAPLQHRADLVGTKVKHLRKGRERWENWIGCADEALVILRSKLRADRTPDQWSEFITRTAWLHAEVTRESESTHDTIRNPNDRRDKRRYRKHWLETKMEDAVVKITRLCVDQFPNDYQYDDGIEQKFALSTTIITMLKPFQVCKLDRKRCLCRYHMQWDYLVHCIWTVRNKIRNQQKLVQCECKITKDPFEFRRLLVCRPEWTSDQESSEDDGDDDDDDARAERAARHKIKRSEKPACVANTCASCPGFKGIICDAERLQDDHPAARARLTAWRETTRICKDRRVLKRHDFVEEDTTIRKAIAEAEQFFPSFNKHHHTMKVIGDDRRIGRRRFPFQWCSLTSDFSQNGDLVPGLEHYGRFFNSVTYTLFGIVAEFHIQDLAPSAFEGVAGLSGEDARDRLLDVFQDSGKSDEEWIVTVSFIFISDDLSHAPYFVQHCFDKILIPWIREHTAPERTILGAQADSDGCPTQFDLADMYLWISKHKAELNFRLEWVIGCAAHGKAKVDPDLGAAKNLVLAMLLRVDPATGLLRMIHDSRDVADVLTEEYSQPSVDIIKKKGVGTCRRFVFHVPCRGPGSAERRIQHCKTLQGSKPLHQFIDVGVPGQLDVREYPCHEPCCIDLDTRNCRFLQIKPAARRVVLEPLSDPGRPLTRGALVQLAEDLGDTVCEGDIVAYDSLDRDLFGLAKIATGFDGDDGAFYLTENQASQPCCGDVEAGERVVLLQLFERVVAGGSNLFRPSTLQQLIRVTRLRRLVQSSEFERQPTAAVATAAGLAPEIFRLDTNAKDSIVALIPCDAPVDHSSGVGEEDNENIASNEASLSEPTSQEKPEAPVPQPRPRCPHPALVIVEGRPNSGDQFAATFDLSPPGDANADDFEARAVAALKPPVAPSGWELVAIDDTHLSGKPSISSAFSRNNRLLYKYYGSPLPPKHFGWYSCSMVGEATQAEKNKTPGVTHKVLFKNRETQNTLPYKFPGAANKKKGAARHITVELAPENYGERWVLLRKSEEVQQET